MWVVTAVGGKVRELSTEDSAAAAAAVAAAVDTACCMTATNEGSATHLPSALSETMVTSSDLSCATMDEVAAGDLFKGKWAVSISGARYSAEVERRS